MSSALSNDMKNPSGVFWTAMFDIKVAAANASAWLNTWITIPGYNSITTIAPSGIIKTSLTIPNQTCGGYLDKICLMIYGKALDTPCAGSPDQSSTTGMCLCDNAALQDRDWEQIFSKLQDFSLPLPTVDTGGVARVLLALAPNDSDLYDCINKTITLINSIWSTLIYGTVPNNAGGDFNLNLSPGTLDASNSVPTKWRAFSETPWANRGQTQSEFVSYIDSRQIVLGLSMRDTKYSKELFNYLMKIFVMGVMPGVLDVSWSGVTNISTSTAGLDAKALMPYPVIWYYPPLPQHWPSGTATTLTVPIKLARGGIMLWCKGDYGGAASYGVPAAKIYQTGNPSNPLSTATCDTDGNGARNWCVFGEDGNGTYSHVPNISANLGGEPTLSSCKMGGCSQLAAARSRQDQLNGPFDNSYASGCPDGMFCKTIDVSLVDVPHNWSYSACENGSMDLSLNYTDTIKCFGNTDILSKYNQHGGYGFISIKTNDTEKSLINNICGNSALDAYSWSLQVAKWYMPAETLCKMPGSSGASIPCTDIIMTDSLTQDYLANASTYGMGWIAAKFSRLESNTTLYPKDVLVYDCTKTGDWFAAISVPYSATTPPAPWIAHGPAPAPISPYYTHLPSPAPAPPAFGSYTVKTGDTCYSIADAQCQDGNDYATEICNAASVCTNLQAGATIKYDCSKTGAKC
jgi:hypothetical protein